MDDMPRKSPALRFVGIDLGNSAARLSKTTYNPEADEFPEPELRVSIPSVVIAGPEGFQTIAKRRELQRATAPDVAQRSVEKDFVWKLGNEPSNPEVKHFIEVMAKRLFKEAQAWLRFPNFDPGRYVATTCVPSDWGAQSAAAQELLSALRQAGFAGIQVVPDAVAAVLFHLHSREHRLPYSEIRTQAWLVIDVGGKSTRFTCVEKPAGTSELRVKGAIRSDWGGDLIDEKLYETLLLPKYWRAAQKPDEKQKALALQLIGELKEKFSAQANRSAMASINFQMEAIQDPVELSKEAFESKDVGQGLIWQFQNLLDERRLKTDPRFQGFEQVIITGGGANWYFVQEAVNYAWQGRCVVAPEPESTVVKGLALVGTGFQPSETLASTPASTPSQPVSEPTQVPPQEVQPPPVVIPRVNSNGRMGPDKGYPVAGHVLLGQRTHVHGRNEAGTWWYVENPTKPSERFWMMADASQVEGDVAAVKIVPPPVHPGMKANTPAVDRQKRARQLTLWCALIGAGIALLLSPFPGVSWPFLSALEIFMLLRIAVTYYGYKITSGTVIVLVVGLLVISTILTIVVGDVIGTLAWLIGMGWLVKLVVAGLVIWGLGEGAIYVLDQFAPSTQAKP